MLTESIEYLHRSPRKGCPERVPLMPSAGGWWGRCFSCDSTFVFGQGKLRDAHGNLWELGEESAWRPDPE